MVCQYVNHTSILYQFFHWNVNSIGMSNLPLEECEGLVSFVKTMVLWSNKSVASHVSIASVN